MPLLSNLKTLHQLINGNHRSNIKRFPRRSLPFIDNFECVYKWSGIERQLDAIFTFYLCACVCVFIVSNASTE